MKGAEITNNKLPSPKAGSKDQRVKKEAVNHFSPTFLRELEGLSLQTKIFVGAGVVVVIIIVAIMIASLLFIRQNLETAKKNPPPPSGAVLFDFEGYEDVLERHSQRKGFTGEARVGSNSDDSDVFEEKSD